MWIVKAKSCNSGFKSAPSIGTIGSTLSKGLDVKIVKAMKAKIIWFKTARVKATNSSSFFQFRKK